MMDRLWSNAACQVRCRPGLGHGEVGSAVEVEVMDSAAVLVRLRIIVYVCTGLAAGAGAQPAADPVALVARAAG